MGQIKFIGGLVMFCIFTIALVLFAVNFATDNTTYSGLEDDFSNSITSGQTNLTTWKTEVINSSESFYQSEISEGENVRTGGHFKLGPATALATAMSFITLSFTSVFGKGTEFAFILTTLGTLFGFILVLYIWKTWKGGNPN